MAKVFITGSADGLGRMAAQLLISQGHSVDLHARNAERGRYAIVQVPGAEKVLTAELSNLEETKKLAAEINALGTFDAVIHNAGVYRASDEMIFAVNTLAPYILTCLVQKPKRLIYMSSSMHMHGDPDLKKLTADKKVASYSDSKLHDLILCMAVARKWPEVYSNAVDPGWVPTKMGGPGAPDSLEKGYQTQAWLAVSNDLEAKVSGCYFYHQKQKHHLNEAGDVNLQEQFLALCEEISGVRFPGDQG
jgi:NAD(P)-dependent dehydrogenase (short-subunit alcohol dehydrogenase family)